MDKFQELKFEKKNSKKSNVQFSYDFNRFYKNANFLPSEFDSSVNRPLRTLKQCSAALNTNTRCSLIETAFTKVIDDIAIDTANSIKGLQTWVAGEYLCMLRRAAVLGVDLTPGKAT